MTTPTPPPVSATDASSVPAYLAAHDFVPTTASDRVYHHPATGARVVIDDRCVTVHAPAGTWTTRLTRAPFDVFAAAVAASTRPAAEAGTPPVTTTAPTAPAPTVGTVRPRRRWSNRELDDAIERVLAARHTATPPATD